MAVFEVRVVFTTGQRKWENVFHIDTGSDDDVTTGILDAIRDFYIPLLLPEYTLMRIARRVVGTHDAFVDFEINLPGTRSVGDSPPLPLFNVIKLEMFGGAGRPGSKDLRGLLAAVDLEDAANTINTAFRAGINAAFETLLGVVVDAGQEFVFGDGKVVTTSSIVPTVQMRQQHRKRKKTT